MFTLHNGDCLEYMKTLQDKSVSAIITDPPYGVSFRENAWDDKIPNWIEQALRISETVIFTTHPTSLWDYPKPNWVGCWYREASNSHSAIGGWNHWTPLVIYGKPKFNVDSIKIHAMAVGNQNMKIDHPTPKPIKLMKWLVTNASKEGETIFDPFTGSGTTGVAAVQLQRNFIGCELEPKYYSIAEKRIKEASLQQNLFTPSNTACTERLDSSATQSSFTAEVIPPAKARGAKRRQ